MRVHNGVDPEFEVTEDYLRSPAKDRDKGQFGDPFEALPTFLPEAEGNWSDSVGPIGILGVRCHPADHRQSRRAPLLRDWAEAAEVQYL